MSKVFIAVCLIVILRWVCIILLSNKDKIKKWPWQIRQPYGVVFIPEDNTVIEGLVFDNCDIIVYGQGVKFLKNTITSSNISYQDIDGEIKMLSVGR